MRINLKFLPFLIAILLVSASAGFAQDDDVIRVNTDLVVINISVTNKEGQYVKSLKASDFKIYEDGVEVPSNMISGFSLQEAPYAAVVLLDSSGSMEARFSLARSAAIRFLEMLY
jgi:Ca-activated chloride channel family protein